MYFPSTDSWNALVQSVTFRERKGVRVGFNYDLDFWSIFVPSYLPVFEKMRAERPTLDRWPNYSLVLIYYIVVLTAF